MLELYLPFIGLPKFEEANKKEVADVWAPPGWDLLKGEGYHGVTQQKIARASLCKSIKAPNHHCLED